MVSIPRPRATCTVSSRLLSSTRMILSTIPGGIWSMVDCSVAAALYAGITTTASRVPTSLEVAGGTRGVRVPAIGSDYKRVRYTRQRHVKPASGGRRPSNLLRAVPHRLFRPGRAVRRQPARLLSAVPRPPPLADRSAADQLLLSHDATPLQLLPGGRAQDIRQQLCDRTARGVFARRIVPRRLSVSPDAFARRGTAAEPGADRHPGGEPRDGSLRKLAVSRLPHGRAPAVRGMDAGSRRPPSQPADAGRLLRPSRPD